VIVSVRGWEAAHEPVAHVPDCPAAMLPLIE
jgi:hypothetical protein